MLNFFRKPSKTTVLFQYWEHYKKYIIAISTATIIVVIASVFLLKGDSYEITPPVATNQDNQDDGNVVYNQDSAHPLTGVECDRKDQRPFAVMLSSDAVVRPLSGIAAADIVVEMPVIQGGITRMMAVFVCDVPDDIGSIRSARNDFIPIAGSLNVIYAHWGGEKQALAKLNNKALDNLNGLVLDGTTFYRKSGIAPPHNGFTNYKNMQAKSQALGYNLTYTGPEYPHIQGNSQHDETSTLSIGYGYGSNVSYAYNPSTNQYARSRGGKAEIDRLSGQQTQTDNVAILVTNMRHDYEQYNKVDIAGSGDLYLAQNGVIVKGRWTKAQTPLESKIFFYDDNGDEIPFVAGKMWIQYVDKNTSVKWAGEDV